MITTTTTKTKTTTAKAKIKAKTQIKLALSVLQNLTGDKYVESLFGGPIRPLHKDTQSTLREPQLEALDVLLPAVYDGKNPFLGGPPGVGKTILMLVMADQVRDHKLCIMAGPKLGPMRGFRKKEYYDYGNGYKIVGGEYRDLESGSLGGKIEELKQTIWSYAGDREYTINCTHATLVGFFKKYKNNSEFHAMMVKCFIFVDEAQYVGHGGDEKGSNKMAGLLRFLLDNDIQHLLASGSPFRADGRLLVPKEHADKYEAFNLSFFDLRFKYTTSYVPDIAISLRCYYRERAKTLAYIEDHSTDLKPYVGHLWALFEHYWEEYAANPVPTLMQVPFASFGMNLSNARIAVLLEEFLLSKNPNLRILNLGGVMVNGKARLVSSTSRKTVEYDRLDPEKEQFDIVLSVAVMKEGMDWPPCSRVFIPNITTNDRLFIQRDIGRGARILPESLVGKYGKKPLLEVVYFVPGLSEEDCVDNSDMVLFWSRILTRFSLLLMAESVHGSEISFDPKFMDDGEKITDISKWTSIKKEVMAGYWVEASRKTYELGGEWTAVDTHNYVFNHPALAGYGSADKVRMAMKLYKASNQTATSIVEECSRRAGSVEFRQFVHLLPEVMAGFHLKDETFERAKRITSMVLDLSGKEPAERIRSAWRAFRGDYVPVEEWKDFVFNAPVLHSYLISNVPRDKGAESAFFKAYKEWARGKVKEFNGKTLPVRPENIPADPKAAYPEEVMYEVA